MRRNSLIFPCLALLSTASLAAAQVPQVPRPDDKSPQPGTTGNAANVPYIGKRDPGGNPVRLAGATGHVSNYDEAKVPAYKLPDPLLLANGQPVTDAPTWFRQRRPEILKFYESEIYGRIPARTPHVSWQVQDADSKARGGTATVRRVVGTMGDKADGPKMHLTLYTPANADKPVAVLLNITFGVGPGRPPGGFDLIAEVLGRGWGYATLGYGDIQPDRADRWNEGVIGLTLKPGQMRPEPDEWGTISAWSWGISRVIDYLESDKSVNAKQIAITGTSRLGKTVLWAGAQDERVAVTRPGSQTVPLQASWGAARPPAGR
jgi:hypothetical protein